MRIESWAWNAARQHLQDTEIGLMMHRVLQAPSWNPSDTERSYILRAMRFDNRSHALQVGEWETLVEAFIEVINDLLAVGPTAPPQWVQPNDQLTHRGLLLRPIGGVFNMVMFESRLAAFMWMHDTVRDWSDASANNPTSSAIFDIGPGGDQDATIEATRLLMLLSIHGEGAAHGRISFRQMSATALLVTVHPPVPAPWDGMMIDATEASWRMHLLEDF